MKARCFGPRPCSSCLAGYSLSPQPQRGLISSLAFSWFGQFQLANPIVVLVNFKVTPGLVWSQGQDPNF
ncbi:hypothetical protein CCM_02740 [Cordyceps militaris CM01]|uniref:Uncharacterized protein n=1 Tax=Cordyceps militaris (strain CM01) TaxID=983644 RepID=G3JBG2_CORMM|nr:uncharacterized protein CCM_02740 [Cordyceps militaris CM01]EGX94469.1 hypothetical protein CCM_02740 [Cordyceps militaris CM01]